ncbi:MAG TPA: DUF6232 family protein [Actinoplanes sp.]|jgi:hypothetical protein
MALDSNISEAGRYFYPGPRIVVTNVYFDTPDGRFYLRDLVFIGVRCHYAYPARTMALYCAVLELLLTVPFAVRFGSVALIGAGLLVAVGMGGAVLRDGRRNPCLMELTAVHRQTPVVLFSSADKTEFGQVRRAVNRAVEANRHHRP